jgi:hypothetical protein
MVSMIASSAVGHEFESRSGMTKNNKNVICCFNAKHFNGLAKVICIKYNEWKYLFSYDDESRFALEHGMLRVYSASSLKQQSIGRPTPPFLATGCIVRIATTIPPAQTEVCRTPKNTTCSDLVLPIIKMLKYTCIY